MRQGRVRQVANNAHLVEGDEFHGEGRKSGQAKDAAPQLHEGVGAMAQLLAEYLSLTATLPEFDDRLKFYHCLLLTSAKPSRPIKAVAARARTPGCVSSQT